LVLEDTNSVRVMMVTGKWVKARVVVVVEEEEVVAVTVAVVEEVMEAVEEAVVAGELKNSIILMAGLRNRKSKDGVGEDIKF